MRGPPALAEVLPAGSGGGKGPLRQEMIDILANVARQQSQRERGAVPAIMAASRVVSACEWELDHETPDLTLAELAGNEERLLEWMRRVMPILEARVAAKRQALTMKAGTDDDGQ